jgi:regulator of sigma E protease
MAGVPALTTTIGGVPEGTPAFIAGIREGDVITAIDGKDITRWEEIKEIITESKGRELNIAIKRDGQIRDISLRPTLLKNQNIFGEEIESYMIGVSPSSQHTVIQRMNPLMAFWTSLKQTWFISKLTVLSVIKILEGVVSPRTLGGPILIAQIAGAQVQEGIIPFMLFMALLSINLAILNLFPIPILDGGHLLFYLIEAITGREINIKWREMAQQIGFIILIILMIFVFIMDIERLNINFSDYINKILNR